MMMMTWSLLNVRSISKENDNEFQVPAIQYNTMQYDTIEGHDQQFRKEEMDVLVLGTGGWLDRDRSRSRSRTYDSSQRSR